MADILNITNEAHKLATELINSNLPGGLQINHIFIISFFQDDHFNYDGIAQDITISQPDRARFAKQFRRYADEIEMVLNDK